MSYTFPSIEWIGAFKDQINTSEAYKESAATWEAGSVCFVVRADSTKGLDQDWHIWLDLLHGQCQDARTVDMTQATQASFTITAAYDRWRQLFNGELDPVKAMMMGQINIKGNLGVLMKYTKSAKDLLECGGKVPALYLGG